MDCKTSTGRQHSGGHPRLAASQAAPGHHHHPQATKVNAARAAPFAVQWPYQTFLELGALPGAVPCARLHTRLVLREWGLAALSDSTELLLSELVTNAVRASRAVWHDAVRMWLVSDLGRVVVFVWDASPQPPTRADPGEDAESGRGLLLVEALSERWGFFGYDGGGKVTWALLEATPAASSDPAARFTPLAHAWPERARHLASGHAGPRTPRTHAASERSTRDVRQPYR
jgi:anti-sigma regulatory factor (Ser/Thr protein kinase)